MNKIDVNPNETLHSLELYIENYLTSNSYNYIKNSDVVKTPAGNTALSNTQPHHYTTTQTHHAHQPQHHITYTVFIWDQYFTYTVINIELSTACISFVRIAGDVFKHRDLVTDMRKNYEGTVTRCQIISPIPVKPSQDDYINVECQHDLEHKQHPCASPLDTFDCKTPIPTDEKIADVIESIKSSLIDISVQYIHIFMQYKLYKHLDESTLCSVVDALLGSTNIEQRTFIAFIVDNLSLTRSKYISLLRPTLTTYNTAPYKVYRNYLVR